MREDLVAAGMNLIPKEFCHVDDVGQLAEPVVVNCTGLGSRQIWVDPDLKPLKVVPIEVTVE